MTTHAEVATDHRATMDALAALTRSLLVLPLNEARGTIDRAHALGPIMDPTGYAAGMKNLQDQADLLDAALKLQAVARRIGGAA